MDSYGIKLYIKDDSSPAEYVDFTDRLEKQGVNKLTDIGTVSHQTESKATLGGSFLSSINSITMNNSDGFWDDPDMWSNLKTVYGNDASFDRSKYGKEILLEKKKCRVVIETLQRDGTVKEDTIGVFRIQDFTTDDTSGTAKLKIVSLNHWLKKLKADKVREGKKWHENKSIPYLMKELLKLEFADEDGDLPSGFTIPDQLTIPTYNGERTLSNYGRPPERVI